MKLQDPYYEFEKRLQAKENDHLNGNPAFLKAMKMLVDIGVKISKEGKDGWQVSDACDLIFLSGHSGLFPTFVGDGFTGGILLHYERDDRAVDVMFNKRDKSGRHAMVSLCEAESSDTPFIPLNTIDATSHEQILSLIKGHLQ